MKKFLLLSLVLLLSITLGVVAQSKIVLKLAHLNAQQPFEIPSASIAAVFKSAVEANSNGRIEVQIYDSGVLGRERETMLQVQQNIVQSYIASTGGMSTFYPLIDVTNLPFAFSSYTVGYKVYDGDFGKAMAEDIRQKTRLR
ncbi:MAG: TRAP transporter substrate-binding protein DctP, partial [Spirochaetales bacterium]